jgi:hypothetical protein
MVRTGAFACAVLALAGAVRAYKVPVKDEDYSRQTCSGMWAGKDTAIEGMRGRRLRARPSLTPHR